MRGGTELEDDGGVVGSWVDGNDDYVLKHTQLKSCHLHCAHTHKHRHIPDVPMISR